MTTLPKAAKRLRELESELLTQGIRVALELTPAGIVVTSEKLADRLLARQHLRELGMTVL